MIMTIRMINNYDNKGVHDSTYAGNNDDDDDVTTTVSSFVTTTTNVIN